MRRWFPVLALIALAACGERVGAVSGPTLAVGGSISGLAITGR